MKAHDKIFIITAALILSSCRDINGQENTKLILAPPLEQSQAGETDFESISKKVFRVRCNSCHRQYDHYAGVVQEISAIETTIQNDRMPKAGQRLDDSQKALLAKWIANGAPEKAGAPTQPLPNDPIMPNWASVSAKIIIPKCLVCHNPQGQAKFLDLSSRDSIIASRNRVFGAGTKLINLEAVDESYLLQILKDEAEPMPPIWSNIPKLNEVEYLALRNWLYKGMP